MTQPAKWLTLPQLNSTCSYWRHSACKNKSGSSKISTYLMVEINCKVFKIYWYVCCWPRPRKVCAGPIVWVWPFNHLRSVAGFTRSGAQGWNSERKITFLSIGMVAVIYHAIFLGDKGVNQSKVFAFCRIKRGFKLLNSLAKITVCPGWAPIGSDQWTNKCWWLNGVFKKLTFDPQTTCKKTLSILK